MAKDNITPEYCLIRNNTIIVNGETLFSPGLNDNDEPFMVKAYRAMNISYPKFFKMDNLSKTGFLAAELLLRKSEIDTQVPKPDVAVVLMTRNASLDTDLNFQSTISDPEAYFPSPSIFVYTLPNIMLGEICIRFRITGEGIVFVEKDINNEVLYGYIKTLFSDGTTTSCIFGWVDYCDGKPEAFISVVTRERVTGSLSEQFFDTFLVKTFGLSNPKQ